MAADSMSKVLATLASHEAELRHFGVRRLRLFGSLARGIPRPESALEFLVALEHKTFDQYMDLKIFLEDLFGRKVDLVLEGTIKPMLRETVEREAVDVARL